MSVKKLSYPQTLLHIFFAFIMLLLQKIGNNYEPFALALLYAMPFCSLSPLICALSYAIVGLFAKNATVALCFTLQAVLIFLGFTAYRSATAKNAKFRKSLWLPYCFLALALALFTVLSPFTP